VEYHPISSVQNRAPIDFDIPGSSEQYIDTSNIQTVVISATMPIPQSHQSTSYFTACSCRWTFRSTARCFQLHKHVIQDNVGNAALLRRRRKDVATDVRDVLQRHARVDGSDPHQVDGVKKTERGTSGVTSTRHRESRVWHDRTYPYRHHLPGALGYMLNEVGIKVRLVRSRDAFCLMRRTSCVYVKSLRKKTAVIST